MDTDIFELSPQCGYIYLGCSSGTFSDRRSGQAINYSNVYVISPIGSSSNSLSYGYKADKFKASPEAFKAAALLKPGSNVTLSFDQFSRLQSISEVG